MPKIGIVADRDTNFAPHAATDAAIAHAAARLGVEVHAEWLPTASLVDRDAEQCLARFDGLFIGPGSPYKCLEGALNAIRFARETRRPLIATCGGMQHVIIEFARNVLGIGDAHHADYDPYASRLFVTLLSCSLAGRTLLINIQRPSLAFNAYQSQQTTERYYCNFGLNAAYRADLESAGLATTGTEAGDETSRGEARIMELAGHPFFVATLFVPQIQSTADAPHPLVLAFVKAADSETT